MLAYTSWMQIKDITPSYVVATMIAVPVWILKYLPISNWIILPLQLVLGIAIFILINKLVKLEEWGEVKTLCAPLLSRFHNNKK